jgi:DNA segregation ATPase FtsK/SpoIIIE, S-DNA-T family
MTTSATRPAATDAAPLPNVREAKARYLAAEEAHRAMAATLTTKQQELAAAQARVVECKATASRVISLARAWSAHFPTWLVEENRRLSVPVREATNKLPVEVAGRFDDPRWLTWTPPPRPLAYRSSLGTDSSVWLRVGDMLGLNPMEGMPGLDDPNANACVPTYRSLFGADTSFIIKSDAKHESAAKQLLQALVIRIAAMLPHQVRFTLLDPIGYGRTFPMAGSLPALRETGVDVATDLRNVLGDIKRILRDVVGFHERFDRLPAETQASERFEIIVAADFPKARAYDRRAIEALAEIAQAGPSAGRYLILHWHADAALPREAADVTFDNAVTIDVAEPGFAPEKPPAPNVAQRILSAIRGAKPTETSAGVDKLLPSEEAWWRESAAEALVAPIGGDRRDLALTFDGSLKSHALVSAAAGGGKSNLLHAVILGLATRYSPDELELYLVDLKEGVEFAPYAQLPHAAVVSLNTEPALARAVVGDLCAELTRRLELFRAAKVQNLADYRRAGSPGGVLPRILLIVDEYQQLFQDTADDAISDDVRLIATQGRAPGVHMLLASQSAGAPAGMLHARHIMDNVLTRVVLRLRPDAIAGLTDFGPAGREMIRGCDQPGKVVVNDQGGQDGGSRLGKVVLVDALERDRAIARLHDRARADGRSRTTQVFDGKESPSLEDNPVICTALASPRAPDRPALGAMARRRWIDGGFERSDWRDNDRPLPLWLGRQQHIHGQATVQLARRDTSNLVVVGGASDGARGMLAGVLASLAAIADPASVEVELLDGGAAEPLVESFRRVAEQRGLRVHRANGADVAARVRALAESLPPGSAPDAPSRVVLLLDPEDVSELRRPADPLSRDRSPTLDALRKLLADGPRSGLHVLIFARSPRALSGVLDDRRGDLRLVRWRAAVQMSEEDSRRLFDQASAASRLEKRSGVLQDLENATIERFMPYRPELPWT